MRNALKLRLRASETGELIERTDGRMADKICRRLRKAENQTINQIFAVEFNRNANRRRLFEAGNIDPGERFSANQSGGTRNDYRARTRSYSAQRRAR